MRSPVLFIKFFAVVSEHLSGLSVGQAVIRKKHIAIQVAKTSRKVTRNLSNGSIWWGEATDEPLEIYLRAKSAREDARPTIWINHPLTTRDLIVNFPLVAANQNRFFAFDKFIPC
jgi:hypothetical protein